jgi:hypothetical protein
VKPTVETDYRIWTLTGSYGSKDDLFAPFRAAILVQKSFPWAAPTAIIVSPLSGEHADAYFDLYEGAGRLASELFENLYDKLNFPPKVNE